MARSIFGILYTLLFLGYCFAALFILFHLLRYSLNRKMAWLGAILFGTVFVVLLFTNALTFLALPIDVLLTPSYSY